MIVSEWSKAGGKIPASRSKPAQENHMRKQLVLNVEMQPLQVSIEKNISLLRSSERSSHCFMDLFLSTFDSH